MSRKAQLFAASLVALSLTSEALANSAQSASTLAQGIRRIKSSIDQIISNSGGHAVSRPGGDSDDRDPFGRNPNGNYSPWLVAPDLDLPEADALALPIMLQSTSSLNSAGSLADQAKLAFLNGNTQLGNFRFAQACNSMGIARSQIARANTAALQLPQGYLAAFGPELRATVIELNDLRISEGCP